MKAMTFSEFCEGHFADDGFELYLVKDVDDKAIYIGISRDSVWHRWFGGGTSHMDIDAAGKIRGRSHIGEVIESYFPASWNWLIELWTREDCLKACKTELSGRAIQRLGIETIEPYMIVRFGPLYNLTHTGKPHAEPITSKALSKPTQKVDNLSVVSIAQAKTMFLESLQLPGSGNTIRAYRNALDTFTDMLANQQFDSSDFPVAKLTENCIADFVAYIKEFAPSTERLYLQVIKSFFNFLDIANLSTVNPSHVRMFIRQRARRSRRQPVEYPEEDVKQLIEFMSNAQNFPALYEDKWDNGALRDARDRALLLTLADTGLGVSEICKLRYGDMDWEARRAFLHGRGKKQTLVQFSTRSINAIKVYLDHRMQSDLGNSRTLLPLPIFARHDKGAGRKIKPVTAMTVQRIVAGRVHQVLGPEAVGSITPHTFLHYFVTTILQATGNLKLAQVLARHTNIQITQMYAHISEREVIQSYSEIFDSL
jgi:integrase/recombinase XerC